MRLLKLWTALASSAESVAAEKKWRRGRIGLLERYRYGFEPWSELRWEVGDHERYNTAAHLRSGAQLAASSTCRRCNNP